MKFSIITHAVHKVKEKDVFTYEPYVREMNLWLKYVDEVQIVAPFSTEKVSSIESKYLFNKNKDSRHPEFISGFHGLDQKEQIATSNTPRNDEKQRHSQQATERSRSVDWESHNEKLKKKILKQACLPDRQVQHDDNIKKRHSEQSEAISSKEQITTSYTPRNNETNCHPEPVEGFYKM